MQKYRIINAFKYTTQQGVEKVSIEGIPQQNKPVTWTKKLFLHLEDAQSIFGTDLDLDKQGLWLFGRTLLVNESYALEPKKNKAQNWEDEEDNF